MSRRGPLIVLAAGLALVAIVVAVLILPKASQVRSKQKEVAQSKQLQQTLQVQYEQLQADAKQAGAERKQLAKLQRQVPPTADLPGIIRSINGLADQSGVDFMIIAPGQPTLQTSGQVSTIPTAITLVGHFFAIDQFLFKLEGLQRASKVVTIQVTQGPQASTDPGQIQVVLTTEFYTSDVSAGPGSVPGATQGVAPGTGSSTGPQPTPSASPSSRSTP